MRKSQLIFILIIMSCTFNVRASVLMPFSNHIGIESSEVYEKALDGDAKAQFEVASSYASLKRPDYTTVILWLKRSANQDYMEAQFALGKIYQFGKPGVPPDFLQAEYWYEKAAQKGDKQALQYLDFLRNRPAYKVESQPTIEEKWDMQWIAKTASYGDVQSQFELAKLYAEGKKMQMDYTQAAKWYEQAALQGHIEAMCALGTLYADGKGVPSDAQKAVFWYNQAALRDYIPAQQKLCELYLDKAEIVFNPVKAAAWLYVSLTFLFPDEKDLTKVSPQLEELWKTLSKEQKEEVLYFAYSFIDENRREK